MGRNDGKTTARLIPKKRDLEIILEKLSPHPKPKVVLEQYTIPAKLAAEMLFIAGIIHDDIKDKVVADLGTGTGRLAIAAALIGARQVIGIEIDEVAIRIARSNADKAGVEVEWIVGDIEAAHGPVDTVIMNPPFGTKIGHSDRIFLSKALEISNAVYSLHKSSTRRYIISLAKRRGGRVESIYHANLEIPHMFPFHTRRKYIVEVDLFRILPSPSKFRENPL